MSENRQTTASCGFFFLHLFNVASEQVISFVLKYRYEGATMKFNNWLRMIRGCEAQRGRRRQRAPVQVPGQIELLQQRTMLSGVSDPGEMEEPGETPEQPPLEEETPMPVEEMPVEEVPTEEEELPTPGEYPCDEGCAGEGPEFEESEYIVQLTGRELTAVGTVVAEIPFTTPDGALVDTFASDMMIRGFRVRPILDNDGQKLIIDLSHTQGPISDTGMAGIEFTVEMFNGNGGDSINVKFRASESTVHFTQTNYFAVLPADASNGMRLSRIVVRHPAGFQPEVLMSALALTPPVADHVAGVYARQALSITKMDETPNDDTLTEFYVIVDDVDQLLEVWT